MGFFDFKIEKVAETVLEQCKLFNCDIRTCWDNYIHPLITEQFTFEEVKNYIENKVTDN